MNEANIQTSKGSLSVRVLKDCILNRGSITNHSSSYTPLSQKQKVFHILYGPLEKFLFVLLFFFQLASMTQTVYPKESVRSLLLFSSSQSLGSLLPLKVTASFASLLKVVSFAFLWSSAGDSALLFQGTCKVSL